MTLKIFIRQMQASDWQFVALIYKEGIKTSLATFETEVPTWGKWDETHIKKCRLVAVFDNKIVGWAALSKVSERAVYKGVAEISVYVTKNIRGKKVGKQLLQNLIHESEKNNFWTLQASIFSENTISISLHKNLGFREIGYRERIAKINDVWKDNILMERRSKIIEINN